MSQSREWLSGAQRSWFEPPDILWQRFRGLVTLEVMKWSVEVYREVAASGPFFGAIDVKDSEITAEARRYMVENTRTRWTRGVVYIGAGSIQRVNTKGMMAKPLFEARPSFEIIYVDTAEQAREWIERQRAKQQRSAG
ncbi:hypothetical protein [Pyxidicoccus xibeiensis]|uniref:hypothetical protein n=1 Tax=Pyxidicoccus xibeiensis TaxID=2906759 RepID=UPI0020A7FBEF|nr:hypothetical protein [Pyxidicoccus xibeiensis]MCP3138060.1 hypothetical protein [Pyxidicoccus xibeiensis]